MGIANAGNLALKKAQTRLVYEFQGLVRVYFKVNGSYLLER